MYNKDIIATLCGYLPRQVILRLAVIDEYIPRSKRVTYNKMDFALGMKYRVVRIYDIYNIEIQTHYFTPIANKYIKCRELCRPIVKIINCYVNYCMNCEKFHIIPSYDCGFSPWTIYIYTRDGLKSMEYDGVDIYEDIMI